MTTFQSLCLLSPVPTSDPDSCSHTFWEEASDGLKTWVPATHVGYLHGASSCWLWLVPGLAVSGIWDVNQQMENSICFYLSSLFFSLCLFLSNLIQKFKSWQNCIWVSWGHLVVSVLGRCVSQILLRGMVTWEKCGGRRTSRKLFRLGISFLSPLSVHSACEEENVSTGYKLLAVTFWN